MDRLVLVGIGTGSPDHLTRAGEAAIRAADIILIPEKGDDKSDLADLRREICRCILGDETDQKLVAYAVPKRDASGDYLTGVNDWHEAIALAWTGALQDRDAQCVALLVWGDPSLYDSSLRIAARLAPEPAIRVVPGITALQALTAAHAIPLNDINAPVLITTGRQLRDHGWPKGAETLAVMLDGEASFQGVDPAGLYIWWGAYLGMKNEVLIDGPLKAVGARIVDARSSAREKHGWIMDTYLLKRRD